MKKSTESERVRLVWSCSYCGTVLALWRVQCPKCHKKGMSWLHVAAVGVVVLPTLVYFLRVF